MDILIGSQFCPQFSKNRILIIFANLAVDKIRSKSSGGAKGADVMSTSMYAATPSSSSSNSNHNRSATAQPGGAGARKTPAQVKAEDRERKVSKVILENFDKKPLKVNVEESLFLSFSLNRSKKRLWIVLIKRTLRRRLHLRRLKAIRRSLRKSRTNSRNRRRKKLRLRYIKARIYSITKTVLSLIRTICRLRLPKTNR